MNNTGGGVSRFCVGLFLSHSAELYREEPSNVFQMIWGIGTFYA